MSVRSAAVLTLSRPQPSPPALLSSHSHPSRRFQYHSRHSCSTTPSVRDFGPTIGFCVHECSCNLQTAAQHTRQQQCLTTIAHEQWSILTTLVLYPYDPGMRDRSMNAVSPTILTRTGRPTGAASLARGHLQVIRVDTPFPQAPAVVRSLRSASCERRSGISEHNRPT
ncbi:hypothetical protein BD413DRAFT_123957 [Trametes elegans]|nr:hypothetical protein BD413DRAFT_123957 [Trametes elegans]